MVFRFAARAARDEAGKIEYIGALMDITERAQAAEALRGSEVLAHGQLDALERRSMCWPTSRNRKNFWSRCCGPSPNS